MMNILMILRGTREVENFPIGKIMSGSTTNQSASSWSDYKQPSV